MTEPFVHPYIPNSSPETRAEMLEAIGVETIEDLYDGIPARLRLDRPLDLPEPLRSELDLRRHVQGLLDRNTPTSEVISFLGGGVWRHDIPAVCDEINARAEFLTAYAGDTYADLGKYQAIFEFQSMIGELVGMDIVSAPLYDGAGAATSALMMAARITGRRRVLVPRALSHEKLAHLRTTGQAHLEIADIAFDPASGQLDLDALRTTIGHDTAAIYLEVPSFFGVIEQDAAEIAAIAHDNGALLVVGVDPISLGVLAPPADYGADLVVGDVQPLGVHMQYSGGLCGFIASRDEVTFASEYPSYMVSIAPGTTPGEIGFGWSTMDRTFYEKREHSSDFGGTTQWLWGITAGVYLALLGPQGMRDVGEGIVQRAHYAAGRLAAIPGVKAPAFGAAHFKEFVVNFDGTGQTVREINAALRERGIFGGHDLSLTHPELGQSALYCVTEVHSKADIDRLAGELKEAIG